MIRLTRKEQFVLIAALGLFLVGLSVKAYRGSTSPSDAIEMVGD